MRKDRGKTKRVDRKKERVISCPLLLKVAYKVQAKDDTLSMPMGKRK
jgi:hypothetical protein